jgi:hypothetical protein
MLSPCKPRLTCVCVVAQYSTCTIVQRDKTMVLSLAFKFSVGWTSFGLRSTWGYPFRLLRGSPYAGVKIRPLEGRRLVCDHGAFSYLRYQHHSILYSKQVKIMMRWLFVLFHPAASYSIDKSVDKSGNCARTIRRYFTARRPASRY